MEFDPWTIGAFVAGILTHIAKKAAKARMLDKNFDLSDYLTGHPYQTAAAVGITVGAYLQLVSDPATQITLFGAWLAGVGANSLADLAPGDRGER